MSRQIFYYGSYPWKYYLANPFDSENLSFDEVSEKEFFDTVTFDRFNFPMRYDEKDINRQNFYNKYGFIIGYRKRV